MGDNVKSCCSLLSRSQLYMGKRWEEKNSFFHQNFILQKWRDEPNGIYGNLLSSFLNTLGKWTPLPILRDSLPDSTSTLSAFLPSPSSTKKVIIAALEAEDAVWHCETLVFDWLWASVSFLTLESSLTSWFLGRLSLVSLGSDFLSAFSSKLLLHLNHLLCFRALMQGQRGK